MSTTNKETGHKEIRRESPGHVRVTETRESIPVKEPHKSQELEQVDAKLKEAAKDARSFIKRNPWIAVAASLALLSIAAYAGGWYGFGDHRTTTEKITDQVKSYLPHKEEHNKWLPWNWNMFHHEPDLSERITGKDFDSHWTNLQKSMLSKSKDFQDSWKKLQDAMHKNQDKMDATLKLSYENFQTSMKSWWDTWENTAHQMRESLSKGADTLANKASKAAETVKEHLPDSLQGGHTEHVHMYDKDQKTHTDTIKVHHHAYDKPADKK